MSHSRCGYKTESDCAHELPDPGESCWKTRCSGFDRTQRSASFCRLEGSGEQLSRLFPARAEIGQKGLTDRDRYLCTAGTPRMHWETVLVLLLYYNAHATVPPRWNRGKSYQYESLPGPKPNTVDAALKRGISSLSMVVLIFAIAMPLSSHELIVQASVQGSFLLRFKCHSSPVRQASKGHRLQS